jgi:hypothetical protein
MQRAYPWLTATFLLGCLAFACLMLRQRTEIVQIGLEQNDADQSARQRTDDLQHRLVAAREARSRAEKELAGLKQSAATAAGSAAGGEDPNVLTIHLSEVIRDHPEYSAIMARQTRRNVLRQYGAGLASLNLPPDQISKLKDLLVERDLSATDAQQAAAAAGLERGSPAWRDAIKQAATDVEHEMTALLGTDASLVMTKLQSDTIIQNQVQSTYVLDFADAGVALNPDQARSLAQAMANSSFGGKDLSTRPAGYNQTDSLTGLSPHDQRTLDAAAQALAPAQLEVLKTDLIEAHQQTAIMQQYRSGPGGGFRIVP